MKERYGRGLLTLDVRGSVKEEVCVNEVGKTARRLSTFVSNAVETRTLR